MKTLLGKKNVEVFFLLTEKIFFSEFPDRNHFRFFFLARYRLVVSISIEKTEFLATSQAAPRFKQKLPPKQLFFGSSSCVFIPAHLLMNKWANKRNFQVPTQILPFSRTAKISCASLKGATPMSINPTLSSDQKWRFIITTRPWVSVSAYYSSINDLKQLAGDRSVEFHHNNDISYMDYG